MAILRSQVKHLNLRVSKTQTVLIVTVNTEEEGMLSTVKVLTTLSATYFTAISLFTGPPSLLTIIRRKALSLEPLVARRHHPGHPGPVTLDIADHEVLNLSRMMSKLSQDKVYIKRIAIRFFA